MEYLEIDLKGKKKLPKSLHVQRNWRETNMRPSISFLKLN